MAAEAADVLLVGFQGGVGEERRAGGVLQVVGGDVGVAGGPRVGRPDAADEVVEVQRAVVRQARMDVAIEAGDLARHVDVGAAEGIGAADVGGRRVVGARLVALAGMAAAVGGAVVKCGKGELTRKRTIRGVQTEGDDSGFDVRLDVDELTSLRGRVLSVHGLTSTVEGPAGRLYQCATRRLLKTLSTDQRHVVAAGDLVWFRVANETEGIIERVEPRVGVLSRAAAAASTSSSSTSINS